VRATPRPQPKLVPEVTAAVVLFDGRV